MHANFSFDQEHRIRKGSRSGQAGQFCRSSPAVELSRNGFKFHFILTAVSFKILFIIQKHSCWLTEEERGDERDSYSFSNLTFNHLKYGHGYK